MNDPSQDHAGVIASYVAEVRHVQGSPALSQPQVLNSRMSLGEQSGAENDASGISNNLTVMTYNLGDGLANADRLTKLLRDLSPAVVGLQEVDEATGNHLAAVEALLPHQVIHPLGIPGKALLSRFPIVASRLLTSDPDRPDLVATLDIAGIAVTIMVAHPPPPYLRRTGLVTREGTAAQVADLLAVITSTPQPLLLLGDFNAVALHSIPRRFAAAGLTDVMKHAGRPLATYPTRLASSGSPPNRIRRLPVRPVFRLDYIWASHHWRVHSSTLGPDAGSDHLPVLATLSLR